MADNPVYVAGGTVQAGGGVYLERAADRELLELCRVGAFAFILTSRQMGKSSLMVRTVEKLSEEGIRSVIIDLTALGADVTRDQWYKGLLLTLEDQLGLTTNATRWWQEHEELGIPQRFNLFLRKVVLAEVTERIVIFVDEIDTTLRLGFTDDFFTAIRYLYNARADTPALGRLSFVLIGVATPGDLIKDPDRTPFNIGHRVELTDFTLDQARPLLAGLSLPAEQEEQVLRWVLDWTGGHPYLTLRVFRSFDEQSLETWSRENVEKRIAALFFGAMSDQDSNLQFVRDMLTKKAPDPAAVLETYRDIRRGRKVQDEDLSLVKSWLKLSGVVCATGGLLRVRNRIYESVFTPEWIREHLQIDWTRVLVRVGRALLIAILVALLPLAVYALIQKDYAWKQKEAAEVAAKKERDARQEAERQMRLATVAARAERSAREDALRERDNARHLEDLAELRGQEALMEKERADSSRREAEQQRRRAESLKEVALARGLAAQASALRKERPESFVLGNLLAVEALRRSSEEAPGAEQILQEALPVLPMSLGRLTVSGEVMGLSSDGSRVLVSKGGEARIIDTATGREFGQIRSSETRHLFFSADGRRVIGQNGPEFILWDATTGRELKRIERGEQFTLLRWTMLSTDGKKLVTSGFEKLLLWDLENGESFGQIPLGSGTTILGVNAGATHAIVSDGGASGLQIRGRVDDSSGGPQPAWAPRLLEGRVVSSAALSADGGRLVTATQDGVVEAWAPPDRMVWKMPGIQVNAEVLFGRNPAHVFVLGRDGTVQLWDTILEREVAQLTHEGRVVSLQFSQDGSRLVTVTGGGVARIWETNSWRELARLGSPNYFGFNLDTSRFVTASTSTVEIWRAGNSQSILLPDEALIDITLSKDGRRLAALGGSGFLYTWDLEARKEFTQLGRGERFVSQVAFGGNHRLLLQSLEGLPSLVVLDFKSGKELARLPVDQEMDDWDLSPDGRWIAVLNQRTIQIFDVSTRKPMALLQEGASGDLMEFSPDGRWLATLNSEEGTTRIWKIPQGQLVFQLSQGSEIVNDLEFSPDSRRILTTSFFKSVLHLRDVETGRTLVEISPGGNLLHKATFSPDGRFVIAATLGGEAYVWDAATGQEVARVSLPGALLRVAFSSDGDDIVTVSPNAFVETHPWRSEDLIAEVCQRLQRDLNPQEWKAYLGDEPYRKTCSELTGSSPR